VGNAISRGNVEVEEMLDRSMPYLSLPEIIEERISSSKTIPSFVSGKHGKTTTTAMLACFSRGQKRPNYSLSGGIAENFGRRTPGGGEEFILEGAPSTIPLVGNSGEVFSRSFPDRPDHTSLEFDHADIYCRFRHVPARIPPPRQLVTAAWSRYRGGDPEAGEDLGNATAKASPAFIRTAFIGQRWVAANVQSDARPDFQVSYKRCNRMRHRLRGEPGAPQRS